MVRRCLEVTGLYSLDVALAPQEAPDIELAVLNPKTVCRFAETLRRSKSDPADALVLLAYAQRMPWQSWQPPRATALALRAITRRFAALTKLHTMERNRLHAAETSKTVPRCVRQDVSARCCGSNGGASACSARLECWWSRIANCRSVPR
jgi:transposase